MAVRNQMKESDAESEKQFVAFVAGVDGCKSGWVWFKLYESGRTECDLVNLPRILKERPLGLAALAIDIPIGLLNGPRACDGAARRLLEPPRASSAFFAPCREALSAKDYGSACDVNSARTGKRLSRQSWSIGRKIKEVDDPTKPDHQRWAFEVHPELCFWHFSGRTAMPHGKKSLLGRSERIKVLESRKNFSWGCFLGRRVFRSRCGFRS